MVDAEAGFGTDDAADAYAAVAEGDDGADRDEAQADGDRPVGGGARVLPAGPGQVDLGGAVGAEVQQYVRLEDGVVGVVEREVGGPGRGRGEQDEQHRHGGDDRAGGEEQDTAPAAGVAERLRPVRENGGLEREDEDHAALRDGHDDVGDTEEPVDTHPDPGEGHGVTERGEAVGEGQGDERRVAAPPAQVSYQDEEAGTGDGQAQGVKDVFHWALFGQRSRVRAMGSASREDGARDVVTCSCRRDPSISASYSSGSL